MNHNQHPADSGYQPRRLDTDTGRDQYGSVPVEDSARAAYAELPGNSGLDPGELATSFTDVWADSATSMETLIRNLTRIDLIEDAIKALADDGLPVDDFVHLDYQALADRVNDRWDIVRRNHLFHAFEK